MKQLIETIVLPLVDYPDDVRITAEESDNRIVYQLFVHPEDRGKVIGKQGRVAKAIRTIVYSARTEENKRVYLDIM